MAERRNGIYIWVTWLAKLMAESNPCWWWGWFKANYKSIETRPTDPKLLVWRAEHTRQVRELCGGLRKPGVLVTTEDANSFRFVTDSGVTVAGKPDIVAVEDRVVTIYDVKTGKRRDSDLLQVMLYIMLLPRARGPFTERRLRGYVAYSDGLAEIPPETIDDKFSELFGYFVGALSGRDPAEKVPNQANCRFCDITAWDCPEGADVLSSKEMVLDDAV
jgi:hypothetical protein